jgi:hypothetical protein
VKEEKAKDLALNSTRILAETLIKVMLLGETLQLTLRNIQKELQ